MFLTLVLALKLKAAPMLLSLFSLLCLPCSSSIGAALSPGTATLLQPSFQTQHSLGWEKESQGQLVEMKAAPVRGRIGLATEEDVRSILVDLYEATNGDHWNINTLWLSDEPFCTWYGLVCTGQDNSLTGISLDDNNLEGSLPSSLGQLVSLQFLNFEGNELRSAPAELGNLTYLTDLLLDRNLLTQLPSSGWASLTALRTLHVRFNEISTLPAQLPPFLTELWVDNNYLSALPSTVTNLTNLQSLRVSSNSLMILPEAIGNLKVLENLDLFNNSLSVLPSTLFGLSNIVSINLDTNNLTEINDGLSKCTNLKYANFQNNQIATPFPEWMCQSNLSSILISRNQFYGPLPDCFVPNTVTEINTYFYASNNNFSGIVPNGLGKVGYEYIDLSHNHFEFLYFSFFQGLTLTKEINLGFNRLLLDPDWYQCSDPVPSSLLQLDFSSALSWSNSTSLNSTVNLIRCISYFESISGLTLSRNNLMAGDSLHLESFFFDNINFLDLSINPLLRIDLSSPEVFQNFPRLQGLDLHRTAAFQDSLVTNFPQTLMGLVYVNVSQTLIPGCNFFSPPTATNPGIISSRLRELTVIGLSTETNAGKDKNCAQYFQPGPSQVVIPFPGTSQLDTGTSLICPSWRFKENQYAILDGDPSFFLYDQCYCANTTQHWDSDLKECLACIVGLCCSPVCNEPQPQVLSGFFPVSSQGVYLTAATTKASAVGSPEDFYEATMIPCYNDACNPQAASNSVECAAIVSSDPIAAANTFSKPFVCADGYEEDSLMCSRCSANYYANGHQCLPCQQWYQWFLPISLFLASAVLLMYAWRKSGKDPKAANSSARVSIILFWLQLIFTLESTLTHISGSGDNMETLSMSLGWLETVTNISPWSFACLPRRTKDVFDFDDGYWTATLTVTVPLMVFCLGKIIERLGCCCKGFRFGASTPKFKESDQLAEALDPQTHQSEEDVVGIGSPIPISIVAPSDTESEVRNRGRPSGYTESQASSFYYSDHLQKELFQKEQDQMLSMGEGTRNPIIRFRFMGAWFVNRFYFPVAYIILVSLRCESVDIVSYGTIRYLQAYPYVDCDTAEYLRIRIFSVFLLIFFILFWPTYQKYSDRTLFKRKRKTRTGRETIFHWRWSSPLRKAMREYFKERT